MAKMSTTRIREEETNQFPERKCHKQNLCSPKINYKNTTKSTTDHLLTTKQETKISYKVTCHCNTTLYLNISTCSHERTFAGINFFFTRETCV